LLQWKPDTGTTAGLHRTGFFPGAVYAHSNVPEYRRGGSGSCLSEQPPALLERRAEEAGAIVREEVEDVDADRHLGHLLWVWRLAGACGEGLERERASRGGVIGADLMRRGGGRGRNATGMLDHKRAAPVSRYIKQLIVSGREATGSVHCPERLWEPYRGSLGL